MRKILGLAFMATLLMSASAFAVDRHLTIVPNATFAAGSPSTTNNNDSCDIGVTPAATLLLPYFEVETATRSTNTLFTITNTSRIPQIAHVTVWTDWSSPVLDFNVFLTGYDVQPISLYDVIVSGIVAPGTPSGTSATTAIGTAATPGSGSTPASNASNPNFIAGFAANCTNLPGSIPPTLAAGVLQVLTTGSSAFYCSGAQIGGNHGTRAVGYVTVDVSAACSQHLPTDASYYTGLDGILYDNVLIGDYQQIGPSPSGSAGTGFDAGGNEMVHIRAIPEGGPAGVITPTNLPFTFYNRYSGVTNSDRRQPLPSVWAARYIQGGSAALSTDYKIWREGLSGVGVTCPPDITWNSALIVTGIVRFDEHENSTGFGFSCQTSPCILGSILPLPETSRTSTSSSNFPPLLSSDVGGWMYLNLSSGGLSAVAGAGNALTASRAGFGAPRTTSQNWVIVSMFGNINASRLSVDFDAAWLGNGCSPAPASGSIIGPLSQTGVGATTPGALICPVGVTCFCPAGAICDQPPVPNP